MCTRTSIHYKFRIACGCDELPALCEHIQRENLSLVKRSAAEQNVAAVGESYAMMRKGA